MKKDPNLTQQEFDDLLNWLAPDRDAAAELYLKLSEGLVRYFRAKGCPDPQILVDETVNRLARNLETIEKWDNHSPISHFYGFAKKIFLEYLNEARNFPGSLEPKLFKLAAPPLVEDEDEEIDDTAFDCLDGCINGLKKDKSKLVIAYFDYGIGEKLASRRRLAEKLKISPGNLQVRIHRIKKIVSECLDDCLQKK